MGNDGFTHDVVGEVWGHGEDEFRNYLRGEGLDRWRAALLELKSSAEEQIARLGPNDELGPDDRQKRAKLITFTRRLDARLSEAGRLIRERNIRITQDHPFNRLRKAIEAHRRAVTAEYNPTEADEALWAEMEAVSAQLTDGLASATTNATN